MTAQHPQSSYEQLVKWYAEHQERLHTPPVFPPAETPAEAQAQLDEQRLWELQEQYGPPLSSYFAPAMRFFGWMGAAFGVIMLWVVTRLDHTVPCSYDWCRSEFQKDGWDFLIIAAIFGIGGLLLLGSARLSDRAADPQRFYTSEGLRNWAGFVRGSTAFAAGFAAAMAMNPRREPQPYDRAAFNKLVTGDVQSVQIKDFQGYNVPFNQGGLPR